MPGRIPRRRDLNSHLSDIKRRLDLRDRAPLTNVFPLISTPGNSAVQNQSLPSVGNMNGTSFYDVQMLTSCVFTLVRPTPIIWFSFATLKLTAPGGGFFAYLYTAVSVYPWNPAAWVFRSGSQLFDKNNPGYLQSQQEFTIASTQVEGSGGPGAPALGLTQGSPTFGPLPPGMYEVRQQVTGDNGLLAAYYQGNIDVYAVGG